MTLTTPSSFSEKTEIKSTPVKNWFNCTNKRKQREVAQLLAYSAKISPQKRLGRSPTKTPSRFAKRANMRCAPPCSFSVAIYRALYL